jgi:hypothetical protein
MRGAHPRTAGELEAQRMKRQRRYGNSMGRGYCMLYRNGLMCPDRAVKMIGDTFVCQHHADLLDEIKRDASKARRRHPNTRLQRAIA